MESTNLHRQTAAARSAAELSYMKVTLRTPGAINWFISTVWNQLGTNEREILLILTARSRWQRKYLQTEKPCLVGVDVINASSPCLRLLRVWSPLALRGTCEVGAVSRYGRSIQEAFGLVKAGSVCVWIINSGLVPLSVPVSRVSMSHARAPELAHRNGFQPLFMLLIPPVRFLLWQANISSVKKVYRVHCGHANRRSAGRPGALNWISLGPCCTLNAFVLIHFHTCNICFSPVRVLNGV